MNRINDIKYRYENFGGIISSEDPPFLAFVDRDYMLDMGLERSNLWQENESIGLLTAPTEVHFAITNKCSVKCSHCYMGSGDIEDNEYDTKNFKKAIDVLSEMNVFHIAMGGGEALEREDLFEVAEYTREKGLVPNLTTSGSIMNDELAKKLKIFGQVNLSIDGLYDDYNIFRKSKVEFDAIDRSIDILIRNKIPTGINCVVGKRNYDHIPEIFEYASKKGLNEIEFLRFKPLGRGIERYNSERTTYEQNIKLIPLLTKMSEKYNITAKIDCSFVPMLCYHKPPKELLYSMATYGCEAGNVLLGIKSNGKISGCSFLETEGLSVLDLSTKFSNSFQRERTVTNNIAEPCNSCDYLEICKGGCHGISLHISGVYEDPDPYCPIVEEYRNKNREKK